MRRTAFFLCSIWLAACNNQRPPAVRAEAARPAPPPSGKEVRLDEAAQRQAGILVEEVTVRSVPQFLQANGRITLNENRTWRVGAVTDGRIVRVFVNPGDRVDEGQVLARMHSHDIHESRAEYQKAMGELVRLRSSEAFGQRVRDRARKLYALKAASLEQVEHAEVEYRNAQTAVANAEVEVDRARKHLVEFLGIPAGEPEHHMHDQHGDEDLIPIKSPATGVVLVRNVTPGTVVGSAGEVFVVADLATLWMMAAVAEEYLAQVRLGTPAQVTVQAFPDRRFSGRVGRLGEQLDPTTRTLQVRVDLPNPAGLLKPEMYATAELAIGRTRPAIFVPEPAVQEVNGHTAVFARTSAGAFEARPVEVGRPIDGQVEITSGLRPGERIVTKGSFVVKSQLLKASLGEE